MGGTEIQNRDERVESVGIDKSDGPDERDDESSTVNHPPQWRSPETLRAFTARLREWALTQKNIPKLDGETFEDYKLRKDALFASIDKKVEDQREKSIQDLEKNIQDMEKNIQDMKNTQDLQKEYQSLQERFPSFEEIVKRPIYISNETDSSAHTSTGHEPATYKTLILPSVELPQSFWQHRPNFKFPTSISSEADVNSALKWLILDVAKGLGLAGYIHSLLGFPVMDTAPDVSIVTQYNKRMMGVVEGKKKPRTEQEKHNIFGSGTAVAGEVFEQLTLVTSQNQSFAVGLVATLQTFQLISTVDSSGWGKLTANAALDFFETQSECGPPAISPEKQKEIVDTSITAALSKPEKQKVDSKDLFVKATAKENATKKGEGKKERIYLTIERKQIPREYFATEPISFSSTEADNRKALELLAVFVLVCVDSLKQTPADPLDLSLPGARCLARKLSIGTERFSFQEISLDYGVQFDSQPSIQQTEFFVMWQLGYGASGACCFACLGATASPCVVKFYHKNDVLQHAQREAENWRAIYGEFGFDFVQIADKPRLLLIMPYLRVPCTCIERQKLVEGGHDSMLYKALKHIADKSYIHTEVFWHHVGLTNTNGPDDASTEIAVFCDLSERSIERCNDASALKAWVQNSFEDMKQRMGDFLHGQTSLK